MALHIIICGDEQQARWWPQFRDVVSPHWQKKNTWHRRTFPAESSLEGNVTDTTATREGQKTTYVIICIWVSVHIGMFY
jgi:hypothetical protein